MDDQQLTTLLTALAEEHAVPGAQAVVQHAGCTAAAAVGCRVVGGPALTADHAFPVGSLTKPFTAALALLLVDDGDLDLDTPVTEWLPALDVGSGVTLRRLLSHTAGLPASVEDGDRAASRAAWLRRHLRAADAVHAAGSMFSYSNTGYVVVGQLVETVTGLTWEEAVQALLLEPLGIPLALVHRPLTGASPSSSTAVGLAAGHTVLPGGRVVAVDDQYLAAVEAPNGGLALSATHLARFAEAFGAGSDHGPLTAAVATAMLRDELSAVTAGPFGLADGWGLGWARYGSGTFGHDGTGEGTSCHLRFDPVRATVVALTTSAATGYALWADMVAALGSDGVVIADHPVGSLRGATVAAPLPPSWLGRYRNGSATFDVRAGSSGDVVLQVDGRPHSRLLYGGDLQFVLQELGTAGAHAGRFVVVGGLDSSQYLQVSGRSARKC